MRDAILAAALIVGTLALAAVYAGAMSRRMRDEIDAEGALRAAVLACEDDDPAFTAAARDVIGHTLLPTTVERVRRLAEKATLSGTNLAAITRELDAAAAVASRIYRPGATA